MKNKHVHEALSEYIDGVCPNEREVARHLQSCPECAQHHMELLKLSNVVRTLPTLEVGHSFTDQVLGRVESTTPLWRWQGQLVVMRKPALAIAAVLALVALGAWYGGEASPPPQSPVSYLLANEAWLDDEIVIEIAGDLLDSAEFIDDPSVREFDVEPPLENDPSIEVLLESLAAAIEDDVDQPAWYETDDLLSVIEMLAEEDVQVLLELTQDHWDEG